MKIKRANKTTTRNTMDINAKLYTHIIKQGHNNTSLNKHYARSLIRQTQSFKNTQSDFSYPNKFITLYEWYKN